MSEAPQPVAMSTPGNSSSLSSDLLEQLKAQLPESLFATVSGAIAAYEKQLDTKSNELQYARLKIQLLEEKLRLQRIAKYGPGSEKLSNLQLELLEYEPGVSNVEVTTEIYTLSLHDALPISPTTPVADCLASRCQGRTWRFAANVASLQEAGSSAWRTEARSTLYRAAFHTPRSRRRLSQTATPEAALLVVREGRKREKNCCLEWTSQQVGEPHSRCLFHNKETAGTQALMQCLCGDS